MARFLVQSTAVTSVDGAVRILSGSTITVTTSAGAIASVYDAASGGSAGANPFVVGGSANFAFWLDDGDTYTVTISKGGASASFTAVSDMRGNAAEGITTSTGTGGLVLADSPVLVTPDLGVPVSVTLTNATGLPISTGVSGLGAGIATQLAAPTTGTGDLVAADSPTITSPAFPSGFTFPAQADATAAQNALGIVTRKNFVTVAGMLLNTTAFTAGDQTAVGGTRYTVGSSSGAGIIGPDAASQYYAPTFAINIGNVVSVKSFGALGDGSPDSAPIQAAINSGRKFIEFPEPSVGYLIDTTLQLPNSGQSFIGDGSGGNGLYTSGAGVDMFNWSGSGPQSQLLFSDLNLYANNTCGNIFTQSQSVSLLTMRNMRITQLNPAASIWSKPTGSLLYIDNRWHDFALFHAASSTVPAFNLIDNGGKVSQNRFDGGRVTYSYGTAPFFNFANQGSGSYSYDNRFTDITAEVCNGGILTAFGHQGLVVDGVNNWDGDTIGNLTGPSVRIGGSTSGGTLLSRGITLRHISRRSGTLGAGVSDIVLDSGKVTNVLIEGGNNANLTGYTVDLGSNTDVTIISAANWTINNASNVGTTMLRGYPSAGYGVTIGDVSMTRTASGTMTLTAATKIALTGPLAAPNVALSNGGVQFPATQVPSADPNTLDDYIEGTWSPTLTFATPGDLAITYASQFGLYQKVGNRVLFEVSLLSSAFTFTTASGNARISLPIAPGTIQSYVPVTQFRGFTLIGGAVFTLLPNTAGSLYGNIYGSGQAISPTVLTTANFTSGTQFEIRVQGFYRTAN